MPYVAGIWSTITGQGELYFDAVGMFALFLLAGRYLERRVPANAPPLPRSWSTCYRRPACAWMPTVRANGFCSANCASVIRCWYRQAPAWPTAELSTASRASMNLC